MDARLGVETTSFRLKQVVEMGFEKKTEYVHIEIWKWETNSITCLNVLTLMIYENAC